MTTPTLLIESRYAAAAGFTAHQFTGPKFQKVMTGVRAPVASELSLRLRCDAALLVISADTVFSHWTAVALFGGPVMSGPAWIEVSVPSLSLRPRRPEVRGRRRVLDVAEVTWVSSYPVTTPDRTFLDLAEVASLAHVVAVGDWFLRRTLVTRETLAIAIAGASGKRGIVNARRAFELLDPGAQSPAESVIRVRLFEDGLPTPSVNVPVFDDEGGWIACPDLSYREAKIAIEYEGAHHLEPNQFRRDTLRDQLLAGMGWTVLRATARDLKTGSATLTDAVRALLAAHDRSRALAIAADRARIAVSEHPKP